MQVEEEVRYQSRRLNRYTCMAVWGGNNELEPALGWFPESRENPILYAVDYADTFVNTIRPILCSVDGGKHAIPFVDSSPSNGILSEDPYVKRCACVASIPKMRWALVSSFLSRALCLMQEETTNK